VEQGGAEGQVAGAGGGGEEGFDLGAAVAAVHAQGHRQGPGQRVQAVAGPLGQEQQQFAELLPPGDGMSERYQAVV